eukprot:7944386-Ditylum_brightwellii.AAC.1
MSAPGTPMNDTAYSLPSNTSNHVTASGIPVNDTVYSVPSNTISLSASVCLILLLHPNLLLQLKVTKMKI